MTYAVDVLGARELVATTMVSNTASRRVLVKLGFTHTRTVHLFWGEPNPDAELGEAEYRLHPSDDAPARRRGGGR